MRVDILFESINSGLAKRGWMTLRQRQYIHDLLKQHAGSPGAEAVGDKFTALARSRRNHHILFRITFVEADLAINALLSVGRRKRSKQAKSKSTNNRTMGGTQ